MPTREDVRKALKCVHRVTEYEFFFKNLNSPDWLEPLEEEGIFLKPDSETNIDESTVKIPFWPPAKYLIKVAPLKAEKVAEIIKKVPDTNNIRIYEDFVEAAIAMPPEVSISLCENILVWLNKPYQLSLPDKVGTLIGNFFQAGYNVQALRLSNKILDIFPSEGYRFLSRSDWEYNELIKLIVPYLKSLEAKISFFFLLCDKLEKAVKSEESLYKDEVNFTDFSFIWRGSIEKSNQNINEGVKDILVNWIRDLGKSLLKENPGSLNNLIHDLHKRNLPIFSRVALYFIRKNLRKSDLVIFSLLDLKLAKATDVWHEYSMLLRDGFPGMNLSSKENLLDFISKLKFSTTNDLDSIEKDERRHYRYYYLIQNDLFGEWKSKFNVMKTKYGEIEHPEYLRYFNSSIKIGPVNPISVDDLCNKSIEEISQFLIQWRPPEDELYGESTYGLAQVLAETVSRRAQEFSENISFFKSNNGSNVRAIIQGFDIALSENKFFLWETVLEYLLWSVDQQDIEYNKKKVDVDKEMQWSGAKDAACRFLEKAFSSTANKLPINLREVIWKIISSSLNDSDPDLARENRVTNKNYYELAINSTRCVALECAIRYGLWVMRFYEIKKEDSSKAKYEELFSVLDKHLDINFEKSKAIRSVYGRWLPWLFLLDYQWTKSNIGRIFPSKTSAKEYRFSAWNAYLLFSEPYDEVFETIENQYIDALDYINENTDVDGNKPITRLVEQIILFYMRGKISLSSSIISKLYEKSDLKIRLHIINFIGRRLTNAVVQRAINFWEFRVNKCEQAGDWKELIGFGWWVKSGHLEDRWALEQTIFVLKKTSYITPAYMIMEKLLTLSIKYPNKVVEIFKLIVDNKIGEHGFFLWRSAAQSLVPILLKTEAREETINIIHKLGGYGLVEFGCFLDDDS